MTTSFYSSEELLQLGFKKIGNNVLISKKASIYGASNMTIGNNVRIDDYCVLSGTIEIGNYVHIAVFNSLFGGDEGIIIHDFATISSRCAIYAKSDDYSGNYLAYPMLPEEYVSRTSERVEIGRHVIIGTGSTILPGASIAEGSAVGCMSLVNHPLKEWGIYVGIPCKLLKKREKNLLELEKKLRQGE